MDDSRNDDDVSETRRMMLALLPALALADTALARDAVKSQPGSYRVVFENDRLRALEYRGRPGMSVVATACTLTRRT